MTQQRPQGPDLPRAARTVREQLDAHGISAEIRVLPDVAKTAKRAAEVLGCPVAAIANSLIFLADGAPLLVMTSGAHRVDTAALAARIGAREITRASPEDVRAATGQAIGGVAPLGHPAPVRTLVDESLAEHPVLWAAAGAPETIFPMSFEELCRITGGRVLPVT